MPLKIKDAVLSFFAGHRGEMFCAGCVSSALRIKEPDIALRAAEGHGAPRRHGRCSRCGKARLVSGMAPLIPISPSSDRTAIITALMIDRPACLPCIATKADVSVTDAENTVEQIETVLTLHRTTGPCRMCGETRPVLCVERPGDC